MKCRICALSIRSRGHHHQSFILDYAEYADLRPKADLTLGSVDVPKHML